MSITNFTQGVYRRFVSNQCTGLQVINVNKKLWYMRQWNSTESCDIWDSETVQKVAIYETVKQYRKLWYMRQWNSTESCDIWDSETVQKVVIYETVKQYKKLWYMRQWNSTESFFYTPQTLFIHFWFFSNTVLIDTIIHNIYITAKPLVICYFSPLKVPRDPERKLTVRIVWHIKKHSLKLFTLLVKTSTVR